MVSKNAQLFGPCWGYFHGFYFKVTHSFIYQHYSIRNTYNITNQLIKIHPPEESWKILCEQSKKEIVHNLWWLPQCTKYFSKTLQKYLSWYANCYPGMKNEGLPNWLSYHWSIKQGSKEFLWGCGFKVVTLEVINTQVIINVFRNKQGLFKKIFQGKILKRVNFVVFFC